MFNVCPGCGQYTDAKAVDPSGPYAVCPYCGHRHRFVRLPLFVLTGVSGTGKTSIALQLPTHLPECVVLESDILWRAEFNRPEDNYAEYRNLCLRLAKNVGQSGRPVVLCGTAVPDQFAARPERRYFAELHYLALVCRDEVLRARLEARPGWRRSGTPEFVERMLSFNRWIVEHAAETRPPMAVLDTSDLSVEVAVRLTANWVRQRLAPRP